MVPTAATPVAAEATPTPGSGRLISFSIGDHAFGFRRPSRADVRDAYRVFAQSLSIGLTTVEADVLNTFDGAALLWEARLTVGLVGNLGETAPAHWFKVVNLEPGKVVPPKEIDFSNVDPDEFGEVVEYLKGALDRKKA